MFTYTEEKEVYERAGTAVVPVSRMGIRKLPRTPV